MEKERKRLATSRVMFHVNSIIESDMETLRLKTRKREIVDKRRLAGYFLYKYTDMTYDEIAEYFHQKDHATIMHHCRAIEDLNGTDMYITDSVFKIESRIIYDLYPVERIDRDTFVANILGLIVWDEFGTTRENLENYHYNQLLIKSRENERIQF